MNEQAIEVFKSGGIVIFPTDTAFGIGCRLDRKQSIEKVFEIRRRPEEKAVLALVGSLEMAEEYVEIPTDVKEKLINKYWPGGLTIILPCNTEKVPAVARANGQTLAVRFPNHPELASVINKVGVPIIAPSANYSGEPTPLSLSEVDQTLLGKVDFIMSGVCTLKGVSTIVDCSVVPWKVVRQGVVQI